MADNVYIRGIAIHDAGDMVFDGVSDRDERGNELH